MNDLEQRLEELFMSDSHSRRVDQVNVNAPRGSRLAPFAFVGAVALATLGLILAFSFLRGGDTVPASSPSPSGSAAVVASASPSGSAGAVASASPGASGSTAPSPSGAGSARADAQHGFITRGDFGGGSEGLMRTESDAAVLMQFSRPILVATTRDGLRVAYIRQTPTGQQLVTFDTATPTAQKTLVDFAPNGESVGDMVWGSDQANEILLEVYRLGAAVGTETPVTYASLRAVDAATGAVREITRVSNGMRLRPLIWRGAASTAAALEWSPAGGFASAYDYIRAGTVTRSPFEPQVIATSVRADSDGQRVLAVGGLPPPRGVTWWPIDRFDARRQLKADPAFDVSTALWRSGTDEIVVFASPLTKTPGTAQRIEAWTTGDQRRTVAEGAAPLGVLRVDGSAAITTGGTLVDLQTGAVTDIPGWDRNQVPYLAVKF